MKTYEEPEMDVDGMEKNSCGKADTTLIYKRRSRRMVKPSTLLKSPFVDNCQKQFKKLNRKERLVENYVFANGMDEEYVHFRLIPLLSSLFVIILFFFTTRLTCHFIFK